MGFRVVSRAFQVFFTEFLRFFMGDGLSEALSMVSECFFGFKDFLLSKGFLIVLRVTGFRPFQEFGFLIESRGESGLGV